MDLQASLVENANRVAKAMGWALENRVMDMRALSFDGSFDHVTSICVLEHLKLKARTTAVARVRNVLRAGGRFSITFDYRNPARTMRIASPQDVEEQIVAPSGLRVRGNRVFADDGPNYLFQPFYFERPFRFWKYKVISVLRGDFRAWEFLRVKRHNDYTFGALFLEK
ncbi:MAG: class I SAM-dependent methyltransferase, partial [Anaerolineae bacterium]